MRYWFWTIAYALFTLVNGHLARTDHWLPAQIWAWVMAGCSFSGFLYFSWMATHRQKVTS